MKEKYDIKILMTETGKSSKEVSFKELQEMLKKQKERRNKLFNKELLSKGNEI